MPPALKAADDRGDLSALEKGLIAASAIITIALFAYLAYEGATRPSGAIPMLHVEPAAGGAWVVLANEGGLGIAEATVRATCGDGEVELAFSNVPAGGERRAFVACGTALEAELAWWTPT